MISRLLDRMTELSRRQLISPSSYLFIVDDGSRDRTWELTYEASLKDERVRGLRLTRNFGHQNALIAGLEAVVDRSDINLCMDADLQHDIGMIESFVRKYHEGYEVVYGVKRERHCDPFFKRSSAKLFYRLLGGMGVKVVYNHADFRLLGNRVLVDLLKYPERNLFLRGMIPSLGYRSVSVDYDVQERLAGKSSYSLRRMLSLALDGITSFSSTPLRIAAGLGFVTVLLSLAQVIQALLAHYQGRTVPGWSTVIISIYFIGGVQLVTLGVMGEYIGKIYSEVKRRPRYLVDETI